LRNSRRTIGRKRRIEYIALGGMIVDKIARWWDRRLSASVIIGLKIMNILILKIGLKSIARCLNVIVSVTIIFPHMVHMISSVCASILTETMIILRRFVITSVVAQVNYHFIDLYGSYLKYFVGFASTWSCSCGLKFGNHVTVFESR
jgi:hypothetical protein